MNDGSDKFHSPTLGTLPFPRVVQEICAYIDDDPKSHYTLIVGTDGRPSEAIDFITAIIMHRRGHGGRYFWKRNQTRKIHSLREQLHTETLLSLDVATQLLNALQQASTRLYDIEIHIDAGLQGPTRDIVKEVIGMVRGNGFTPRMKPDSYGASKVADRHT